MTRSAPTPWRHDSELALVRDWFFPQHVRPDPYSGVPTDMRRRACDKVDLWRWKTHRVPHPVIATQLLTDAMLHDGQKDRQMFITDAAMRSIYAMAFLRFVNGFVDRDIAKAASAVLRLDEGGAASEEHSGMPPATAASTARGDSSMYAHAAAIGMPEAFVDLRHHATHGELPSLLYLTKMTEAALEWLWQRWWKASAQGDSEKALREIEDRRELGRQTRETRRVRDEQQKTMNEAPEQLEDSTRPEISSNGKRKQYSDPQVDALIHLVDEYERKQAADYSKQQTEKQLVGDV